MQLHFTPTYSSWLNQVELWFGRIERDVIARGVFTSVADLRKKLMRYIRHYNKAPRIVKWKYSDTSNARHRSLAQLGPQDPAARPKTSEPAPLQLFR